MKKHVLLLLALAGCYASGLAQGPTLGVTHFYPAELSARTVEPHPGTGEFVMTETYHDPSGGQNNAIHFVRYRDLSGSGSPYIISNYIYDHPKYDERNVDICYNPATDNFFIVTYAQDYSNNGHSFVKVLIVDPMGVLGNMNAFESIDPNYGSLIPLDGAYDPNYDQYIVVGTAVKHISNYSRNVKKVAFVATLDASLSLLNLVYYNSDPKLGQALDFDMANKIIVDPVSKYYYITGSENIDKNGKHMMGIRNMLIDPISLMPTTPGWHEPLFITDPYSNENSADMVVALTPQPNLEKFAFNILCNSTANNNGISKWHLLRVKPSDGKPFPMNVASALFGYDSYGHSIMEGNEKKEVVVSGMKYRYEDDCDKWDKEATPFLATVDVASDWVGILNNHTEYYTAMSNQPYWTMGGIYSPLNGYPVPSYVNNFADREGPNRSYGLAAPIKGAFGPLNTKYLQIYPSTEGCKYIQCNYDLTYKEKFETTYPELEYGKLDWQYTDKDIDNKRIAKPEYRTCEDGWFKSGPTTAIGEVENNQEDIHIYPNPVSNEITISLNGSYKDKNVRIALYDVAGRQIAMLHNGSSGKTTLKLELPQTVTTGIYLLQINADNEEAITKKITVDR